MTRFSVDLDRAFYERLRAEADRRTRLSEGIIAPRGGGAFAVDATQVLRITQVEGTQICDLNAWNRFGRAWKPAPLVRDDRMTRQR